MSLLGTWSHDHYSDLLLEYAADSNAVISAGAGRNNTAAISTIAGTTYWLLDRVAEGQGFALLQLFYGISFRLDALPVSGQGTLLQFNSAGPTPQIAITVDSTGTIQVYSGSQNGTLLDTAVNPVVIDRAYYLEVGLFIDNAAGTVEIRLWQNSTDVDTIIDFTGDTLAGGSGEITTIGNTDGIPPVDAIPLTCNYDDAYLCDSEGTAFNDFLGNKHIQARFPDDAGFYTEWSPVPGIPNFGNVDENPPDGDTSYNYAPNTSSATFPSLRSVTSSLNSPTITTPTGSNGDVIFVAIRSSAAESDGAVQPDLVDQGFGSDVEIPPFPLIVTLPHFHFFDPFSLGSPSDTVWIGSVAWRVADGTEPASYTFIDTRGDPLENVLEIAMIRYKDVNLAIPIEDASTKAASVKGTTISFTSVDANTDNDLIVAFEFAETQIPQTPSGYTANYGGTFINVSSKVNPTASGVVVPSTTLAGADTWGSDAYSLKAMAEIEAGGADTFATENTAATEVDAVTVKLCTRVDSPSHTVGARMRQNDVDLDSAGVAPETDYKIFQFPFETAPDTSDWTAAKYNASEAGYALDAEEPPPPPEEAVIFWVDADQLDTTFDDGDPLTSFVEFGIYGYTMSLARSIAGDFIPQTFETNVAAVNNQDSIQGFTESLSCTPSTRNIGYTNTATNSDLWLPDEFTLIAVFNLSQYDGCWQNGNPVIITRRGNDAGADFAGWILTAARDGAGDPGASGKIIFYRFDSSFSPICTVNSTSNSILENTTYVVTVICDGATLKMRVNGVEVSSTAYSTGIEPAGNDLHFLNNGSGIDPPQGQVPYVKIWNIELDNADLVAEETALIAKY